MQALYNKIDFKNNLDILIFKLKLKLKKILEA